jgi:hypothetical protein
MLARREMKLRPEWLIIATASGLPEKHRTKWQKPRQ